MLFMAKQFEGENRQLNMIVSGTKITGDIETTGDLRIEGQIDGNIVCKGKVVLGQPGVINGTIKCGNCQIEGKFEGKMEVSELLTLTNTANFKGEMTTMKLAIDPGAVFNGTCTMVNKSAQAEVKK